MSDFSLQMLERVQSGLDDLTSFADLSALNTAGEIEVSVVTDSPSKTYSLCKCCFLEFTNFKATRRGWEEDRVV